MWAHSLSSRFLPRNTKMPHLPEASPHPSSLPYCSVPRSRCPVLPRALPAAHCQTQRLPTALLHDQSVASDTRGHAAPQTFPLWSPPTASCPAPAPAVRSPELLPHLRSLPPYTAPAATWHDGLCPDPPERQPSCPPQPTVRSSFQQNRPNCLPSQLPAITLALSPRCTACLSSVPSCITWLLPTVTTPTRVRPWAISSQPRSTALMQCPFPHLLASRLLAHLQRAAQTGFLKSRLTPGQHAPCGLPCPEGTTDGDGHGAQ